MVQYISVVGFVAVGVTVLMIAAMLYLVLDVLEEDVHTATPDEGDGPALVDDDEGADSDETQAELTADGNSA